MHVFLYEWITGGGLIEETGRLPPSLLSEGLAMITALSTDFARIEGCQVSVLRDVRLDAPPIPGCQMLEIHSAANWREEFDRLAAQADWSLAIAPEFDGILRQTVQRIAAAGGKSLNSSDEFIALTADKHQTAERLRQTGVPAPLGWLLAEEEAKLPVDFPYPAVLKPVDGAGSQHVLLVEGPTDEPPPYAWPRRLEQYHPGRPASIAALCGDAVPVMLPPCWQDLSSDGRFVYRGGSLIGDGEPAERAGALARRALDALPAAKGYVGVDLVLGDARDGSEDAVIEINPRLTTSYIGLRQAVEQNLAAAMLNVVAGRSVNLTMRYPNVKFFAADDEWTVRPC